MTAATTLDKRTDEELAQLEAELAARREKFASAKTEAEAAVAAAQGARQLALPDAPTDKQIDEARQAIARLDSDLAGIAAAEAQIEEEKQRRLVVAEVAELEAQRVARTAAIDAFVQELDGLDKAIIAVCKRFVAAEQARLRVWPMFSAEDRLAMPPVGRPDGLRATARLWLAARSQNVLAPMHGLMTAHQLTHGDEGRPPRPSMADEGRVLHNIVQTIVAQRTV